MYQRMNNFIPFFLSTLFWKYEHFGIIERGKKEPGVFFCICLGEWWKFGVCEGLGECSSWMKHIFKRSCIYAPVHFHFGCLMECCVSLFNSYLVLLNGRWMCHKSCVVWKAGWFVNDLTRAETKQLILQPKISRTKEWCQWWR